MCRRDIYFAVLALAAVFLPHGGQAQSAASSACDPAFYQKLQEKASDEAQREISQTQNLIQKPDSVLSMSCFDKTAASYVKNAKFTGEKGEGDFGYSPAVTPRDNENSINELLEKVGEHEAGYNKDGKVTTDPISQTGNDNCENMNAVWEDAKCENFEEIAAQNFVTLSESETTVAKACEPAQ